MQATGNYRNVNHQCQRDLGISTQTLLIARGLRQCAALTLSRLAVRNPPQSLTPASRDPSAGAAINPNLEGTRQRGRAKRLVREFVAQVKLFPRSHQGDGSPSSALLVGRHCWLSDMRMAARAVTELWTTGSTARCCLWQFRRPAPALAPLSTGELRWAAIISR